MATITINIEDVYSGKSFFTKEMHKQIVEEVNNNTARLEKILKLLEMKSPSSKDISESLHIGKFLCGLNKNNDYPYIYLNSFL